MITVEYSIYESYENHPYPVVIRETKNAGTSIGADLVKVDEAEAAGIDSGEYLELYTNYMSDYIVKLATLGELSSDKQRTLFINAANATGAYLDYMEGRWLGF